MAKKKTAPKPTSLITFLLDRSGSMASCKNATIEGFNGYLKGLQDEADAKIDFTFLQFDSVGMDKVCVAIPVATAVPLTTESYQPRAGTPLIDASVKTVNAVAASLAARDDKPKVVVCIQTDGEENESRHHTWEELRALIAAKMAEGWEFNFMGAGIDAYQQGARMGIHAGSTMSYDPHDLNATRSAFVASSSNARGYASGRAGNTSYTLDQRASAGDRFVPPTLGGAGGGRSSGANGGGNSAGNGGQGGTVPRGHGMAGRAAALDLTTLKAPTAPDLDLTH